MIEMKERTLKGEALMDSAVLSAAAAEESESGPVTVARGSIEQVFFSMAGRSFFKSDLVFPLRSSTGKLKHGSISEWRQFRINGLPRIAMIVSSGTALLALKLSRKHSSINAENWRNSADSATRVLKDSQ